MEPNRRKVGVSGCAPAPQKAREQGDPYCAPIRPHPLSDVLAVPAEATFTLRRMDAIDRAGVRTLWDDRFGGDRSTQDNWMDAALDPSRSAVGIVATAPPNESVVGFSFLDVGDPAYTRRYLGLDTLDVTAPLAGRNGIFHLSCVNPDWERRGIASRFYERRLAVLRRRDVSRAFGIAWHRPHTVDSRVLFEKFGFEPWATVERYYARTGGRSGCPDCGGECTCTASLYGRTIDRS